MFIPTSTENGKRPDEQFEEWIDQAVAESYDPLDLAEGIANVTRPGGIGNYEVSPELYGGEAWFWPWNRAGFQLIRLGRPDEAAELFTFAYLASLRFQWVGQYRLHKGLPLCNVSYAYLQAHNLRLAALPAILGMIEDQ